MLESRSALERYRAETGIDGRNGRREVRIGELADTRLLHLGIYPGGAARVAAGVLPVLGSQLPESRVCAAEAATPSGGQLIMRIAPDQYWILGADSVLETRLRAAIPADAGCLTSLEGARTRLLIEGNAARALLGRLVAIDLDPAIFPVLGFAQTVIHHAAGLLFRAAEDRYEFLALRTFAASTWEVLLDAAHSFGYDIVFQEKP